MRTEFEVWTNLSLLFFLVTAGCAHFDRSNEKIAGFYEASGIVVDDRNFLNGKVIDLDESKLIYQRGAERMAKVFKTRFASEADLLTHLKYRQVAISALFRDFIEPYYGLVERKKCVDLAQFNTDFVEPRPDEKYFTVKLPVDQYLNPLDCERDEPRLHAQYIFLACEKRLEVYEFRLYQPISAPFDDSIHFHCK
jgi:hypothetical protein